MFTGLIEALGHCVRVEPAGEGRRLVVAAPGIAGGVGVGDSVAVNGVCLTVVSVLGEELAFDVVPETLRVTTLGGLRPGDPVNLERALRLGDRLGGHLIQGHVDAVGRITGREPAGNSVLFRIEAPPGVMSYIVPKGSVAVDGISLTVVECDTAGFTVAIIPHTAERTTMGARHAGDAVNLEADIIAKYVARWVFSITAHRGAGHGSGGPGGPGRVRDELRGRNPEISTRAGSLTGRARRQATALQAGGNRCPRRRRAPRGGPCPRRGGGSRKGRPSPHRTSPPASKMPWPTCAPGA